MKGRKCEEKTKHQPVVCKNGKIRKTDSCSEVGNLWPGHAGQCSAGHCHAGQYSSLSADAPKNSHLQPSHLAPAASELSSRQVSVALQFHSPQPAADYQCRLLHRSGNPVLHGRLPVYNIHHSTFQVTITKPSQAFLIYF